MTTMFTSTSLQRRAFAVECPARNQVLHGDGVVATAQTLALVQLMCGGHGVVVELDAETGCVRHREVAVDDLVGLRW